jgi:antitoxin (DNA-binding transcriptional repressor) of toxin-antitoxin stability system
MKVNRAAAVAMTVAGSVAIGVVIAIVDRAETVAVIVAIEGRQWQQRLCRLPK